MDEIVASKPPPPVPGRGINREYLLLQNFVENERRQRAKVLRNQQLEKYYSEEDFVNEKSKYPTRVSYHQNCLVEEAIVNGNKYEVLNLIKNGLPLSYTNSHGMSLLHLSCMYDDYIIAQALIKEGISCNAVDHHGWTPLHVCAVYDSMKCAQLLVSNDANLLAMDRDNYLAVDLASLHGHLRSTLLKNINSRCKLDEVGLRNLQTSGYKRMAKDIKHLLERNQNIDQPITRGMTLLHAATCHGYLSLIKVLLENNANVNAVDDDLWTPLHCAAKYNQPQGVKLLLAYYANPHSRTSLGHTPADLASIGNLRQKLLDAQENFLDLSQQRTPAKTKRFSASLLDQNDEEEQRAMRVKTRVIRSKPISSTDVKRENEIVKRNMEELKNVLEDEKNPVASPPAVSPRRRYDSTQSEMIPHQGYDNLQSSTGTGSYQGYYDLQSAASPYHSYTSTQNFEPTNLMFDEPLPPPPSLEEMETMASRSLVDSSYLKAVVICQRAVRNFLSRCHLERSATFCTFYSSRVQPTFPQEAIGNEPFTPSGIHHSMSYTSSGNHEEHHPRMTVSNPIPVVDNRRYSTDVYSISKQWTDHNTGRPLSTGAISPSQYNASREPVWIPLKDSKPNKTSPPHDVRLTNTVKRSLTMTATQRRELQPTKYPTVKLRRTPSGQEHEPSTNYTMPPLTSTVATMINLAAQPQADNNLMPPPTRPPPSAYSRVPQHHRQPPQSPLTTSPNTSTLPSPRSHQPTYDGTLTRPRKHGSQRYGTLLSNRANILRDSRLQQSVKGSANEYRHSWSHEKMGVATTPTRYHNEQPVVMEERKRFSDSFDGKSTEAMIDQLRQLNVRHKRSNANNSNNNHDDDQRHDNNEQLSEDQTDHSVPPTLPQRDDLNTPVKSKNPLNLKMTLSNSPLDESDLPEVPPPLQLYSDLPSPRRFLGNNNDNRPPTFSTFLSK